MIRKLQFFEKTASSAESCSFSIFAGQRTGRLLKCSDLPIEDPCMVYIIYANIGDILMVNVTIYSSTMDPIWVCDVNATCFFGCAEVPSPRCFLQVPSISWRTVMCLLFDQLKWFVLRYGTPKDDAVDGMVMW